jgi:aminocarboxymuconate-semialdehyde decarboxylase
VLAPFNPTLSDLDARIAAMEATGVDVQMLSGWIDLTAYALDAGAGAEYSRRFNEIITAEAAKHPDRLTPLGTITLQDPNAAAEELDFAVRNLGMAGVQIATTVAGTDLDETGLDPFWEAASALGCLIVLHPCDPLPGVDLSRNFRQHGGPPCGEHDRGGHLLFSVSCNAFQAWSSVSCTGWFRSLPAGPNAARLRGRPGCPPRT